MDLKLVNKVCATSASTALELHKMAKNTNSGDKSKTTNTGEEWNKTNQEKPLKRFKSENNNQSLVHLII